MAEATEGDVRGGHPKQRWVNFLDQVCRAKAVVRCIRIGGNKLLDSVGRIAQLCQGAQLGVGKHIPQTTKKQCNGKDCKWQEPFHTHNLNPECVLI